jgi:cell division protein FtsB
MPSRPPPRYVVRPHDAREQRRRRLWLGAAWLASLLLVGAGATLLAGHAAPQVISHKTRLRQLASENEDLKQQVANLQRSQQVTQIATASLRKTLADRDEEISGLRADLGFYSRLLGGSAAREGLKVQEVQLQAVPGSHAWNLTISLTQSVKRDDDTTGTATVSVDGLRGDKVVQLAWPMLGDAAQKDGLPFRFKYFQQLHATIVLPADFRPTRLRVEAQPAGGDAVARAVTWSDALTGHVTITQGEANAQP